MTRVAFPRLVVGLVVAAGLVGCDKKPDGKPPRQPVRGTVTYNGKPIKGAAVVFWPLPLDKNDWRTVKPQGGTEADGSYQLNSYDPNDGAMAGEYAVTVTWTGETNEPMPELFGGRFGNPKNPVLKVSIKEGNNEIPPIKLTGPPIEPPGGAGAGKGS